MSVCRAKYSAMCYRCGLAIIPGQMIDWQRGSQSARHAACQTPKQRAVAPFDREKGNYVNGANPKNQETTRKCAGCGLDFTTTRDDDTPIVFCDSCVYLNAARAGENGR